MVVEVWVPDEVPHAAASAVLGGAGAEHQFGDAGVLHGPGAHHTGLKGYVKLAANQAIIAQFFCCLPHSLDFRVGCRIMFAYRRVVATPDDFAILDDDGADRD